MGSRLRGSDGVPRRVLCAHAVPAVRSMSIVRCMPLRRCRCGQRPGAVAHGRMFGRARIRRSVMRVFLMFSMVRVMLRMRGQGGGECSQCDIGKPTRAHATSPMRTSRIMPASM